MPVLVGSPAGRSRRAVGRLASRLSVTILLVAAASIVAGGCRGGGFARQYEYEEEMYLSLDGSATVYVNASVPALVELRGVDLDVNPRARLDRTRLRALYASPVVTVTRVSLSRRDNRRFVHVRLDVPDVRRLHEEPMLAWSAYRFAQDGDLFVYRQIVGASAGRPVGEVGWSGRELAAFRLHLPSKIAYHNAPSRQVERGNILAWEQPLAARAAGTPVSIEVRMETESILYRTLALFGTMMVLVAITFGLVIWWVARRGRHAGT